MRKEDIKDISTWIYKDQEEASPLPAQIYKKGYDIMKGKGYDGTSGLGKNKTGRCESSIPPRRPKLLGLWYGLPKNDDWCTNVLSSGSVNALESDKTIEESLTETDSHEGEFGSQHP